MGWRKPEVPGAWRLRAAVVGAMVRQSREARGLSLKEMHRRCGMTRERMSLLERGERRPSWATLVRLSCVFYPDDDELALRAARRLAQAAGPALCPSSHVPPPDERALRLYERGPQSEGSSVCRRGRIAG